MAQFVHNPNTSTADSQQFHIYVYEETELPRPPQPGMDVELQQKALIPSSLIADDCSFTGSLGSEHSIRSLGSLSGKAIQAVGEAILGGIDGFIVRRRLHFLTSRIYGVYIPQDSFPQAYYKDLFQYQR